MLPLEGNWALKKKKKKLTYCADMPKWSVFPGEPWDEKD